MSDSQSASALPAATTMTKVVLLGAASLTIMSGAAISTALPSIEAAFPGNQLLTRLLLTLPALFILFCAPVAGIVADRWGRKPLLLGGLCLFVLAGTSGMYLGDFSLLLAGRALLGVAVAGVITSANTLVADYFTGAERQRFMGFQGATMSLGGVCFLVGGGLLAQWSWRANFAIYLLALPLIPLAWRHLAETRGIAGGGPDHADTTPMPLWKVVRVFAFAAYTMGVFYLIPTQMPFFLKELAGASPAMTGICIAASTLAAGVSSSQFGRFGKGMSHARRLAFASGMMGLGMAGLWWAAGIPSVLVSMAVFGSGMGWLMPANTFRLAELSPPRLRGRLMGILSSSLFLGQFVSPLFSQPLIARWGYGAAYGAAGLTLLASCAALMVLDRMGRRV
ncbi:MAG: MFS transporter [Candidatus Hydrogenedens sp.]|nr:MFS transporter [Candidatus Hydrogenedentota bacterium]NLF58012.1 MFS transporter [Candidatus Hydrogenedens sp.]